MITPTTERHHYKSMMMPCDKLKTLPDVQQYLKEGVTFTRIDGRARAMSEK